MYSVVSVSLLGVFEDVGVYPIMIFGNKLTHSFCQFEVDHLDELRSNSLRIRPMTKKHQTLKDFGIKIASGTTGFQATELLKYISENPHPKCIPFIVSGSIDSYRICFDDVRYMKKKYKRAFIGKGDDIAASKWSFWQQEKIVIAGMTKKIEAAYIKEPLALGVGVYAIYDYGPFDPKFLLALLNSRYLSYYLITRFKEKHLAGGYLAINKSTIEQLPIIKADKAEQKPFIHLVDEIQAIVKEPEYLTSSNLQGEVKKLQIQLDQMVYQLFQLLPEEIETIKGGGN